MLDDLLPSGLESRAFSGVEDYASIADLVNVQARADGEEYHATADEVRVDFEHTANYDPVADLRFVLDGSLSVGYVTTRWHEEVDGPRVYRHMCKLRPTYQRRGIGSAMLAWAVDHLTRAALEHKPAPSVLRTGLADTALHAIGLLESGGYQSVEHFASLVRPDLNSIPDIPLPAEVRVVPVEEGHLRAIWESDVEAFRDHWGYTEQTEQDYQRFLAGPLNDSSLWKVAWAGDGVVGQVRSFIDPEENRAYERRRGYTEDISTAREWRGRGVASALICESLRELKRRGMTEAALGVHVANPNGAYRLYQSLGFEVVETSATWERPFDPWGVGDAAVSNSA